MAYPQRVDDYYSIDAVPHLLSLKFQEILKRNGPECFYICIVIGYRIEHSTSDVRRTYFILMKI